MCQLVIGYCNENPNTDIVKLLIAAIFRDFNHSAGQFNDHINIINATNGLMCFYVSVNEKNEIYFSDQDCRFIIDIIKSTEFPYNEEPKNEYGKILRECDNLVCFMDDFFTQVLFGLKSEMHVTDLNQLVENEMKILNNSWNMLTLDYSKNIISIYKQELIDEINIFKNILQ